jgi:HSP20 family protein
LKAAPESPSAELTNRHFPENLMSVLLRTEPLAGLDGLLDEFLRPAFVRPARGPAPRRIHVDVKETPEAYVVLAELPGVRKEAIRIDVEANEVAIATETSAAREAKDGEKWLHVERHAGRSERRFALPAQVDAARAEAKLADGVLELRLPKKVLTGALKVEVH